MISKPYRCVLYTESGEEVVLWRGTNRECLAYQAGAHAHAENDYVNVVGPGCPCGVLREEVTQLAHPFVRTGCKRCNRWDGPPVYMGKNP